MFDMALLMHTNKDTLFYFILLKSKSISRSNVISVMVVIMQIVVKLTGASTTKHSRQRYRDYYIRKSLIKNSVPHVSSRHGIRVVKWSF